MRRSCVLALLLVLAATPASADIGLVADLDGNYQNGPDTLQIEPGDTVLVHVWITGADDSLQGFGITIGDSSGALVWVEEPAESTYTIPSGWMQVDGALDQEGQVLLQGQDFSYSAPLILPSQAAELKFTLAPGESCGTIGWDPEMSGWQDWGFDDGTFDNPVGALICSGVTFDSGDDTGGAGEDDTGGEAGGGVGGDSPGGDEERTCFYVMLPSDRHEHIDSQIGMWIGVQDLWTGEWVPNCSLRAEAIVVDTSGWHRHRNLSTRMRHLIAEFTVQPV